MANAASNNIQPAQKIAPEHNDRTMSPNYLLGDSSKNICTRSADEVNQYIERINQIGIKLYEEFIKQKFQKKTTSVVESVINFNENHTLQDIINVASFMAIKYGFSILQVAMHYDEGVFIKNMETINEQILEPGKDIFYTDELWFDKKGDQINDPRDDGWEVKLNLHAHILMHNLRMQERCVERNRKKGDTYIEILKPGTTIFQKMSVTELRTLQSETALILNMKRGIPGQKRKKFQDLKSEKHNITKAKQEVHEHYQSNIYQLQEVINDLQAQNELLKLQTLEKEQLNNNMALELISLKNKQSQINIEELNKNNEYLLAAKEYYEEENGFLLAELGEIDGLILASATAQQIYERRINNLRDENEIYLTKKEKVMKEFINTFKDDDTEKIFRNSNEGYNCLLNGKDDEVENNKP